MHSLRFGALTALATVLYFTQPAAAAIRTEPAKADASASTFQGTEAYEGLLPVHVDMGTGRILLTLPAPAADGVAARFLYSPSLRTGLGSAPTFLDRGRIGDTQILAFRRLGKKIAIVFENPRFKPAGAETGKPSGDFATSIVWMTDIIATSPDGSLVIDIGPFLATDMLGVAASLEQSDGGMGTGGGQGAGSGFRLDAQLSTADPGSVKVFPDNIEIDAILTFASDKPGAEVENIAPKPNRVSFTVHHSFVRLPDAGFTPRVFDPRIGGFETQVVDFGALLGQDVVRDLANRFRLEKTDPSAARSTVKKPIVFYVDRAAPEPMRSAILEGAGWWAQAFDAAGLIDAFQVELLPEGADPLDVRYSMVNWVDRATRGWSYGQEIVDPRTGEIIKGMVVLGSLRTRQDIELYKGLVGAGETGTGSPNDPARVALSRLKQLAAHEVGHALGFAHNFAASTQDRASVMDYPPPRVGLIDGKPDLSDAYGTGTGQWDKATVAWLYGAATEAEASRQADSTIAAGLRFVPDDNARSVGTAQPWGGLWDDGANPTAELKRLMQVRKVALERFGLDNLSPGEPMANLRRRFVPVWLLHRYEVAATAKAIGGVDFTYAVKGGGHEAANPLSADAQRAALDALLATLSPDALRVPKRLQPLLSSARNGSYNRQYEIEVMDTPGGPVFDPLGAAETGAQVTLNALLAPARLTRLHIQHSLDPAQPGVSEVLDRLIGATLPAKANDPVARRIASQTLWNLARVSHQSATDPEVAALIDARLIEVARQLSRYKGSAEESAWAADLSRRLLDPAAVKAYLADHKVQADIPPGEPIGSE